MFTYFGKEEGWVLKEIRKGWSEDRKYRVRTKEGRLFLLRVSADRHLLEKKQEWARMCIAKAQGLPMTAPVDFMHFEEEGEVHMLLTYLPGVELLEVLPSLPPLVQYALGKQAGGLLKTLHQCPSPISGEDLEGRMRRKTEGRLQRYADCGLRLENEGDFLERLLQFPPHLKEASSVLLHGDYHPGNMVRMPDGTIGILDFNRSEYGDPYEDFNRMVMFTAETSPLFSLGQLHGYFDGSPPEDFYDALAWYAAGDCVGGLPWSITFGEEEIQKHRGRAAKIFSEYKGFQEGLPKWIPQGEDQLSALFSMEGTGRETEKNTAPSMVRIPSVEYNNGKKQNPRRGRREWRA